MKLKVVTGIILTLLLVNMLTLALNIQPAKATGTIYIKTDGSVDPPDAPIQRDGDLYTFTDNIYDFIIIERDNIVVDGADYTVEGTGIGTGIYLLQRSNVILKNIRIINFQCGIKVESSNNNTLRDNYLANFNFSFSIRYLLYANNDLHARSALTKE